MISSDQYFERIVAGIHSLASPGAEVKWNEHINGRQFDVVIRFSMGLLSYIVLIEAKNKSRKASASDLEAFVTKSRDQNANKMVFVTAAGFQSGAIEVARRHGVEVFVVNFNESSPILPDSASYLLVRHKGGTAKAKQEWSVGEPTLAAIFESITLRFENGKEFDLPDEQSQMNYYCRKTTLSDGSTLHDIIHNTDLPEIIAGQSVKGAIFFQPARLVSGPDDYYFPKGWISGIRYTITGQLARPIRGNILFEPGSLIYPIVYTNVLTGVRNQFAPNHLPLGDRQVEAGRFYFLPNPLMYYYCADVSDGEVLWHLVESFQNGELIRMTGRQDASFSQQYTPVSDKKILQRLEKRLESYLERNKSR